MLLVQVYFLNTSHKILSYSYTIFSNYKINYEACRLPLELSDFAQKKIRPDLVDFFKDQVGFLEQNRLQPTILFFLKRVTRFFKNIYFNLRAKNIFSKK